MVMEGVAGASLLGGDLVVWRWDHSEAGGVEFTLHGLPTCATQQGASKDTTCDVLVEGRGRWRGVGIPAYATLLPIVNSSGINVVVFVPSLGVGRAPASLSILDSNGKQVKLKNAVPPTASVIGMVGASAGDGVVLLAHVTDSGLRIQEYGEDGALVNAMEVDLVREVGLDVWGRLSRGLRSIRMLDTGSVEGDSPRIVISCLSSDYSLLVHLLPEGGIESLEVGSVGARLGAALQWDRKGGDRGAEYLTGAPYAHASRDGDPSNDRVGRVDCRSLRTGLKYSAWGRKHGELFGYCVDTVVENGQELLLVGAPGRLPDSDQGGVVYVLAGRGGLERALLRGTPPDELGLSHFFGEDIVAIPDRSDSHALVFVLEHLNVLPTHSLPRSRLHVFCLKECLQ